MIVRPVIVIPVFDNPATVAETIARCLQHSECPLIVVDDGSPVTVESLIDPSPRVTVIRKEKNEGKGQALHDAMTRAVESGYTHALTIDADGQHNPEDVPVFLKAMARQPWSLIVGCRRLVGSVPARSKFGRQFSNFWIQYLTGVHVKDSQSGYRLYPLVSFQNLSLSGRRYNYEVEIFVKLLWRGVGLREVDVDCQYQQTEQYVSHFRLVKDNAIISMTYTFMVLQFLFFKNFSAYATAGAVLAAAATEGLLGPELGPVKLCFLSVLCFFWRLNASVLLVTVAALYGVGIVFGGDGPLLGVALSLLIWSLAKLLAIPKPDRPWSGVLRGGALGNGFLIALLRGCGLRATYLCLWFVVPYFFAFSATARSSSKHLFDAIKPRRSLSVGTRLRFSFGHFIQFGQVFLDRLYIRVGGGSAFKIDVPQASVFKVLGEESAGALCVGAHHGSMEVAGECHARLRVFLRRLLRVEFSTKEGLNMATAFRFESGIETLNRPPLLRLRSELSRGRHIFMLADRPMTPQCELIPFFGKLAAFDLTPFRLAAMTGCRVFYCSCIRIGFKHYRLNVQEIVNEGDSESTSIEQRAMQMLTRYVESLEQSVASSPGQWANFYNFWQEHSLAAKGKVARVSVFANSRNHHEADESRGSPPSKPVGIS